MWEVTPGGVEPGSQAGTKSILKECQRDQGVVLLKQGGTGYQEGHGNQGRKEDEFKNKNMTVKPEGLPCVLFSTVLLLKI